MNMILLYSTKYAYNIICLPDTQFDLVLPSRYRFLAPSCNHKSYNNIVIIYDYMRYDDYAPVFGVVIILV